MAWVEPGMQEVQVPLNVGNAFLHLYTCEPFGAVTFEAVGVRLDKPSRAFRRAATSPRSRIAAHRLHRAVRSPGRRALRLKLGSLSVR